MNARTWICLAWMTASPAVGAEDPPRAWGAVATMETPCDDDCHGCACDHRLEALERRLTALEARVALEPSFAPRPKEEKLASESQPARESPPARVETIERAAVRTMDCSSGRCRPITRYRR